MPYLRWLSTLLLLALAAGLAYAVLSLPDQAQGLRLAVTEQMPHSGVSHPVTAVLLNFRGYDTLLEMAVLLLALLGVWSLGGSASARPQAPPGSILDTLQRLLLPLLIIVAAYLLWSGAHAPGGAFQAGAVLGAAGVLLFLTGWQPPAGVTRHRLRFALVAGLVAFLAVALLALAAGRQLLEYDPAHAGTIILVIETLATVSIGVTLALLFSGADMAGNDQQ